MKPVIKFEFYRAFRSGGFYVALLLGNGSGNRRYRTLS